MLLHPFGNNGGKYGNEDGFPPSLPNEQTISNNDSFCSNSWSHSNIDMLDPVTMKFSHRTSNRGAYYGILAIEVQVL